MFVVYTFHTDLKFVSLTVWCIQLTAQFVSNAEKALVLLNHCEHTAYPLKYVHVSVVFCFVVVALFIGWFSADSRGSFTHILQGCFPLALGQSYDYPSASEATQKNVDKIDRYQTLTNQEKCAWFLRYIVYNYMIDILLYMVITSWSNYNN